MVNCENEILSPVKSIINIINNNVRRCSRIILEILLFNDIIEFIESLNQDQFNKIENFFNNLPKLNKSIEVDCKKCGFHHTIQVEGLDSFFA